MNFPYILQIKSYYVEGGFSHLIHMTAAHLWWMEQQLEGTMHEKPFLIMLLSAKQKTSQLLGEDAENRQARQMIMRRRSTEQLKRSDALLRYSFFYSGDNDYRNSVVSFCNTALLLISDFFSTPLAKQKEAWYNMTRRTEMVIWMVDELGFYRLWNRTTSQGASLAAATVRGLILTVSHKEQMGELYPQVLEALVYGACRESYLNTQKGRRNAAFPRHAG